MLYLRVKITASGMSNEQLSRFQYMQSDERSLRIRSWPTATIRSAPASAYAA